MAEVKVLKCSCRHDYQDSIYGVGMRVMNPAPSDKPKEYVCTICERRVSIDNLKGKV
jgi:hypothetical protein